MNEKNSHMQCYTPYSMYRIVMYCNLFVDNTNCKYDVVLYVTDARTKTSS